MTRADSHKNPTAFTTDIAKLGGLKQGSEYVAGDPFKVGPSTLYTARILGDPLKLTIQVIDKIGFYTKIGSQRWSYIALPKFIWDFLKTQQKVDVIGFMYQKESGDRMKSLFPHYGNK